MTDPASDVPAEAPADLLVAPPPPVTGVDAVDEALAELATALAGPLDQRVAAVERGHDLLRRALDEPDRSG